MATTKARPRPKARPAAVRKASAHKAVATRKPPVKAPARKAPSSKAVTVTVASLPGKASMVTMASGKATLQEALRLFGVRNAHDVRVNNKPVAATSNQALQEGAFVTVVGRVNGGL